MTDIKQLKQIAIDRNPLDDYLRRMGVELSKKGTELQCCCRFHSDTNPSMSVNVDKGLYHCFSCSASGNVIGSHMHEKGLEFVDAVKELADYREPVEQKDRTITYEYKDAYGKTLFCVDRIEKIGQKKTFRQYHIVDGKRVYNLDGVYRVLYRLDKIAEKEQVFIAEGEKAVHALVRMGYDATTNCGGSSGWLPAYAESLRDKNVVIMPDSDAPGEKWYNAVLESLKGKAKSIQTLRMPPRYNDIADAYAELGEDAVDIIIDLSEANPPVKRGEGVPIYSYDELMEAHRKQVTAKHRIMCDLGRWLPSFKKVRPLVPGEMLCLMAGTGVGKSAIAQNIALSVPDMTTLMFQLELPEGMMAERWTAIATKKDAQQIERMVQSGEIYDSKRIDACKNIYTCTLSGLTVDQIEDIVNQSELKMGKRPDIVMVDYVGLIAGKGSRYEKTSDAVEQLKVVAKRTNVIMIICAQISRKMKDDSSIEVGLQDAKDSGTIENSCSLVIGSWRPNREEITLKVLKDTKSGTAGLYINCSHGGANLVIREVMGGHNENS